MSEPMTTKTKLTVVVVALVLVVALLVCMKKIRLPIPYPDSLLQETATITVEASGNACRVADRPAELLIITKPKHAVRWKIAGNCPDHTVSVGGFVFAGDGRQLDPTEERTREVKAEEGQTITAKVKEEGSQAPRGRYTYLVLIDGRLAGADPEFKICPDWPCE